MAREPKAAGAQDWRRFASTAALIATVLGTLLLGAVLQRDGTAGIGEPVALHDATDADDSTSGLPAADPTRGASEPVDATPSPSASPSAAAPPEPVHSDAPLAGTIVGDAELVDRAIEDERRLAASGNGYTLQYAVVCDAQNARGRLARLADERQFYLLTMLYEDRACFRLCWGFFDSAEQARASTDAPAALAEISSNPRPLSSAEALP